MTHRDFPLKAFCKCSFFFKKNHPGFAIMKKSLWELNGFDYIICLEKPPGLDYILITAPLQCLIAFILIQDMIN